jgi:phage tail sheath protein FI
MPSYLSPGVYVEEVPPLAQPIAGVGTSTAAFIGYVAADTVQLPAPLKGQAGKFTAATINLATPAKQAKLITNWAEFVKYFGDLVGPEQTTGDPAAAAVAIDNGYRNLAQAVYGFFNNGGTRCYVVRVTGDADLGGALNALGPIDEIAILAIPGVTTKAVQENLIDHAENLEDRVVILDGVQNPAEFKKDVIRGGTKNSSYAALYFPWIKVFDPSEKLMHPAGDGTISVAPSGHLAGIYARVDANRGVYKAPANESVRGALDVQFRLAKADQDGLNPGGVNVIRAFNGNITVWGARTLGGDDNGEFKHVSTRRCFNLLRESIDKGTQFVVFEPNSPALWQRIKRSVSDFLLGQWRAGALFGETPEKAFFVKCDAETNPPDVREQGQVITVIGVAIVKPAEFVIFRIQQQTGG